jgi:hypothetical protein
MIASGGDIDRRVYGSSRGNELEIGKALDDFAGQRGPLAHDTNDIKGQQPLNHGVRIGEVVLKHGDVGSITEHRPIGALKGHILVIVQNSDLVFLHWYPSRAVIDSAGEEGSVYQSSVCCSGFDIRLRAPFERQEEVGGWESFLHGDYETIRISGLFEFLFKR